MDSVTLGTFRQSDREAVCALWQRVFQNEPPWNDPEIIIDRKLTEQPELFLVARLDGHVVGTVLCGFDGCRAWIHHLAVDPEARRQGIATRLMAEAERLAAERGAPKLNLQVVEGNDAALAFYRALGYRIEKRVSLSKLVDGDSLPLRHAE